MGKDSEGNSPSSGNGFGTREACHISGRQEEDRNGDEGEMGKIPGAEGEEGGLEPAEPITRIVLHSRFSEEYQHLCCLWLMPSVEACAPVHSFEEPTFPASKGWLVRPPR
jgi:hypothetical protein